MLHVDQQLNTPVSETDPRPICCVHQGLTQHPRLRQQLSPHRICRTASQYLSNRGYWTALSHFQLSFNNVCNADCTVLRVCHMTCAYFAGGRPLCTQILPGEDRPPSNSLGIRKLETLGHLTVKTTSICVPSFPRFDTIPECDRQTDLP